MKQVTLTHLRVFREVADCLSITQAASRLFRTQPAVSRQLAELEAELGVALFVRQGRRLSLTLEAKDLLARSRALLNGADELSARAQELAAGNAGMLRIGAMTATLESVMPAILAAYRVRWPNVVTRFLDVDTRDLLSQIESGELDLAFGRDVKSDAVAEQRMFPMHLIATIPLAHPLSNRAALEVSDLVREALLLTPPGTGSRVLLDQACQAEGLNLRDVRMESRAYSALVAMSEAGCGIAVTLSTVAVAHPKLKVVPIRHRGTLLGIWFTGIWHRRRELPPYARAFVTTARITTRINYPGKHYGFPPLPV